MRSELADITNKYSEHITKLYKLEKATWKKLDELQTQCEKCTEDVHNTAENMVKHWMNVEFELQVLNGLGF